jgi:ParB family transcriptional regulator, chromosome partitioning protein
LFDVSKGRLALGKGLGSLIPNSSQTGDTEHVTVAATPESIDDGQLFNVLAHIDVDRIESNPFQPRTDFDAEAIRELAQSILENGLVQPITVRRHEGKYQLISGERRVRACQEAGVMHIPAYIRQVETAEEMIELSLIENIQREMLNPIEVALAYQRLSDECHFSQEQIAQKVGKNRSTVVNFIRLLKLPAQIRESVRKNELSMGHARALINIPDESAQLRIWQKTVREGLSVRTVEELAQHIQEPLRKKKSVKKPDSSSPQLDEYITKLRSKYATKVHMSASAAGKGAVSFEFYSHEDLERILDLLLNT